MSKFHEFLYERCIELALMSNCKKRKFGAVIVSGDKFQIEGEGFNQKIPLLSDFDCCALRASIPSGTRTEFCGAIHAEMMALQNFFKNGGGLSVNPKITVYVAGLNDDGSYFDNSKGFYCLPCAKELMFAGISCIGLAGPKTPETGKWVLVSMENAVRQSLEFTKGTMKV